MGDAAEVALGDLGTLFRLEDGSFGREGLTVGF